MNRNSNGMSTGMALLCTLGILLFIGWMIDLGTPKCNKSGCDNDANNNENKVEAEFANKGIRKFILEDTDIGDNEVYRQLPVGLFRMKAGRTKGTYNCSKDTMVFTGGESAIDLWTWQDKSFKVIELKTENPMIGIITEIFFYSNYMYDFLIREWKKDVGFKLNEQYLKNKDDRGYSNCLC